MKIWAWGAAVGSVIALVACGGGSSGNTGGTGGTGTGGSTNTTVTSTGTSSHTTTTSTGMGGQGGGGPACGISYDSTRPMCESCMESKCCDQLGVCGDTTSDCYALLDCLNKCAMGDGACQNTCVNAHSQGYTDYQAIQTCYYQSCQQDPGCEYAVTCNGKSTMSVLIPDDKCATCLGTSCCSEYSACDADATCQTCAPEFPASTMGQPAACGSNAAFMAANTCTTTHCADVCNFTGICDTMRTTHDNACDYALGQNCCMEFKTCIGDMACITCIQNGGANCAGTAQTEYNALKTCWNTNAATQCGMF